ISQFHRDCEYGDISGVAGSSIARSVGRLWVWLAAHLSPVPAPQALKSIRQRSLLPANSPCSWLFADCDRSSRVRRRFILSSAHPRDNSTRDLHATNRRDRRNRHPQPIDHLDRAIALPLRENAPFE